MSDFLEDELTERERKRVARHLARCKRCRALLASLSRTIEQLRSLGAMERLTPSPATAEAVVKRIEEGT